MCAKLGELFELAKRKALTANIFLEGEAFNNLQVKEFLQGVGYRNSINHSLRRTLVLPARLFSNYRTLAIVICFKIYKENLINTPSTAVWGQIC